MKDNFCFKGERNYLHSTTLMDYIVSRIISSDDDLKNIDFSMAKFTDKICDVIPDDQMQADVPSIVGQFRYEDRKLFIIETSDKITQRIEYNESEIVDQCDFIEDNGIMVSENVVRFSFMEKVIAAYKALLQQMFSESYQSFFFIRITLDKIPKGQIEVTFNRIISKKYFQAAITQHGKKIGELFFGAR